MAHRSRKQHYTDGSETPLSDERVAVSNFSVTEGTGSISGNSLTVYPNTGDARSVTIRATYQDAVPKERTYTQLAAKQERPDEPEVFAYYGHSETEPTSGIETSALVRFTNSATVEIETETFDKAKYHWVAYIPESGIKVTKWVDVDNDNVLDVATTKKLGIFELVFIKSSVYINNTSKITLSKN